MISGGERPSSQFLAALLEARTGQQLSPSRQWRIEASLKPLIDEIGCGSLDGLVARLGAGQDSTLEIRIVEALLNNETSFFRDIGLFRQLETEALEVLRASRRTKRRLRIWSAACSSGQEAYSLAMMLRDDPARWQGWTFDIVATDVSGTAIGRAREGRYSTFEIQRGLPARTMLRWFTQKNGDWLVEPALKASIHFGTGNLLDAAPGRFDLILCRNVLMYFSLPLRARALRRIADALDPEGILMLGAGETIIGMTDRLETHCRVPSFYTSASPQQLVAAE